MLSTSLLGPIGRVSSVRPRVRGVPIGGRGGELDGCAGSAAEATKADGRVVPSRRHLRSSSRSRRPGASVHHWFGRQPGGARSPAGRVIYPAPTRPSRWVPRRQRRAPDSPRGEARRQAATGCVFSLGACGWIDLRKGNDPPRVSSTQCPPSLATTVDLSSARVALPRSIRSSIRARLVASELGKRPTPVPSAPSFRTRANPSLCHGSRAIMTWPHSR